MSELRPSPLTSMKVQKFKKSTHQNLQSYFLEPRNDDSRKLTDKNVNLKIFKKLTENFLRHYIVNKNFGFPKRHLIGCLSAVQSLRRKNSVQISILGMPGKFELDRYINPYAAGIRNFLFKLNFRISHRVWMIIGGGRRQELVTYTDTMHRMLIQVSSNFSCLKSCDYFI